MARASLEKRVLYTLTLEFSRNQEDAPNKDAPPTDSKQGGVEAKDTN